MFRKVQLKFFAFTTAVLLALFAGVLVSINLIMDIVMQRQSKVVLQQIASSIEYDDATSTFTYFEQKSPPDEHEPTPEPPSGTPPAIPSENPDPSASDETQQNSTDGENDPTSGTAGEASSEGTENTVPNTEKPSGTDAPELTTTAAASSQGARTTTQTAKPPQTSAGSEPVQPPTLPDYQQPTKPFEDFPAQENTLPTRPSWEEDRPPHQEDDYPYNPDDNWNNNDYYDYPQPDHPEYWDKNYYQQYNAEEPTAAAASVMAFMPNSANGFSIMPMSVSQLTPSYGGLRTLLMNTPEPEKKEPAPVPKSLGSIEFFVLMSDKDGNYLASLNNDDLTAETAQTYINKVLKQDASNGMLDNLQFCSLGKINGTLMVFTDRSAEFEMLDQLTHTTFIIGIISFIVLSILTMFLSKKSIEPIKTAFEKQKQFISDASHELKTPLTIISANADVLSDEIGDNKWLEYIKSQTDRMNLLVNDLLNLTRLENNTADFICSDFNLSKAIENTALPFECQAFEMQKVFEIDIQENLMLNGSERHVKQMAAIFIDNALKYSNDGGTVRVMLKTQGDKKILSVFNTGSGVKESEKDKIFERFYRSDDSRARTTGGYGLGLAIAKSIIDKHKFKVSIDNAEGSSICFNVIM
ncbi:MAG: hypothetical protein IJX77_00595 [Ruminococcus sp.]|nr:hypothetical protein [Ruminococcus sp.]